MASSEPAGRATLLRLAPVDNLAVATGALRTGQAVACDGLTITLAQDVPVGHKVAIQAIPAGGKAIKFACPIGSATRAIAPGEHIHTHNLKSDYLPTFTHEEGKQFVPQRSHAP